MRETSPQSSSIRPCLKPVGSYLADAGLLSHDQIKVILADQQATGMRFGDIAVARGWVREQTVEWVMTKVVVPERRVAQHAQGTIAPPSPPMPLTDTLIQESTVRQPYAYKGLPISKPLPSVKSTQSADEVNWVG